MDNIEMLMTAVVHSVYAQLRRWVPPVADDDRDRGYSIETVLWFVAAGAMVAVIAAIVWGKIRDEANKPVTPPSAP